jgi:hypothetical protein
VWRVQRGLRLRGRRLHITQPVRNQRFDCNQGEVGGGCESSEVCQDDATCGTVLDLLGLIQINTCGECATDDDCGGKRCVPVVTVSTFSGSTMCLGIGSLAQDSFCDLEGDGDAACERGLCAPVDVMGLAEVGACGECKGDTDCPDSSPPCGDGTLDISTGALTGSSCN